MSKKNYDLELYDTKSKKSDCNIILDDVEGVFGEWPPGLLGACFRGYGKKLKCGNMALL